MFEDEVNIYILMELCTGPLSYVLRERTRFHIIEVRTFTAHLAKALLYMRQKRIIHRNINISNILIAADMELKLSDFMLARQLENEL